MVASKSMFSKLFWIIIIVFLLIFVRELNPFDGKMFIAHDETQSARVSEFSLNLVNGNIPPRISPNMSFGMGYPIFNYYAPFAYWVSSTLNLLGIPIIQSLEISYLLAIITGFLGMLLFLKKYFSLWPSVVGGLLYVSSPFVAVDIFVRGNMAEAWFLGLFPLALYVLTKVNKKNLFITALIVSFLFSAHNIFSLLSVGILIIYSILIRNKYAALSILGGLILSAYFLIPALVELPLVQASQIATFTQYTDHFLCPAQLWYSPWGFGGSTSGCINDGMSFMVGKLQILLGLGGLILLTKQIIIKQKSKHTALIISVALLLIMSFFLTTEYSAFIWHTFERILALFQFPWRFLLFVIFGLSFIGAYGISELEKWLPRRIMFLIVILIYLGILMLNAKFFYGNTISNSEYNSTYISTAYIRNIAAYKVAEYLPISASYDRWRMLEDGKIRENYDIPQERTQLFDRVSIQQAGEDAILNIHNANYWNITSDGKMIKPESYDALGRPIIAATADTKKIRVTYKQTELQQLANTITVLGGIILFVYSFYPYSWYKNRKKT